MQKYFNADDAGLAVLDFAMVLHPRCKLLGTLGTLNRGWSAAQRNQIRREFSQYYRVSYASFFPDEVPDDLGNSRSRFQPSALENLTDYLLQASTAPSQRTGVHGGQQVNKYLDAPVSSETDVLRWWKGHERMYPGLAQMARDVFAALVSGVGVERLFSYARDVCGHKRGSLNL